MATQLAQQLLNKCSKQSSLEHRVATVARCGVASAAVIFRRRACPALLRTTGRSLRGRLMGFVADAKLPDTWTTTENVAWKTDHAGTRLVEPDRVGRQDLSSPRASTRARPKSRRRDCISAASGRSRRSPSTSGTSICLDLNDGQHPVGANGAQGRAGHAHPHQEQLRLGNARDRRRAGVCLLRQRGRVLLRPGRQAALEERDRAAQDAIWLGHGRLARAVRGTAVSS